MVYLILPGPISVKDFQPVSKSVYSTDWWNNQLPNREAYYLNDRRAVITAHYKDELQRLYCEQKSFLQLNQIFCLMKPLVINHPPEETIDKIQKEMKSTFFEEYYYPFREPLYVSGYEPFDENGVPFKLGVKPVIVGTTFYNTQVNLRFIPSSVYLRVLAYILTWAALVLIVKFAKKI